MNNQDPNNPDSSQKFPPPSYNPNNPYLPPYQQQFFPQPNIPFYPPPNYPPANASSNFGPQSQPVSASNPEISTTKNTNVVKKMMSAEMQKKLQGIKEKFSKLKLKDDLQLKPENAMSDRSLKMSASGHLSQKEILKLVWPCMIFQVEVTEKKEDRLFVVIKELLAFAYDGDDLPDDKYDYTDFKKDILKTPKAFEELKKIRAYQIAGQIKKYDVDETNLLSYFIDFTTIKKNDLLVAIVKRKEDTLVSMSIKNSYISGCKQRKFEEYEPNKPHDYSVFYRLGYLDLPKAERSVLDIDPFFEEKLNFPNHNLFDITSPNYAEYNRGFATLQIKDPNATLRVDTNSQVFINLKMNFRKIREFQNTVWGRESLKQGIELTQHQLYEDAIPFFDNAIAMDDTLADAYVAKGCALSNLGKLHEGLKMMEKALDIEADHEDAKRYYEAVLAKIKEAEKDVFKIDDRTKVTLVRTKKNSDKEPTSGLILSDSDDESRHKKSKKKRY